MLAEFSYHRLLFFGRFIPKEYTIRKRIFDIILTQTSSSWSQHIVLKDKTAMKQLWAKTGKNDFSWPFNENRNSEHNKQAKNYT